MHRDPPLRCVGLFVPSTCAVIMLDWRYPCILNTSSSRVVRYVCCCACMRTTKMWNARAIRRRVTRLRRMTMSRRTSAYVRI